MASRPLLPDLEAALGAGTAAVRETVTPFVGAGRYLYQGGEGGAADAMGWAKQMMGPLSYEPSPEGQQSQQDIAQALMGGAETLYDASGLDSIANTGYVQGIKEKAGEVWGGLSEDVKAGAEMLTAGLDIIPQIGLAGALPLVMRGKRGGSELIDAMTQVNKKGDMPLVDELEEIRNSRQALEDYHNDVEFIQADTIDYTIDERLGKRKATGQYRGAPRTVTSPQKLGKMRTELTRLLEKGTPGRLWYDESTEAAGKLTGGKPRDKHLYAGSNAITSRGAAVPSNQVFGVKGYNQALTGDAIDTGRFPVSQGEAIDTLRSGTPYEGGPKETPFYEGLTIDERAEGIRPTNDLWMARAFDYTTPEGELWSEGLGQAQHRFMDNEINALVETANKAKIGGVDDWTPERVQAAIWVAKKAEMEGTDVAKASLNFKDNLDNLTANIRYEAFPSTSLDHMSGISGSDEYADLTNTMLQNDAGQDRGALGVGALTRPSARGYGEYEGNVSPSTTTPVLASVETGKARMDKASEKLVNTIAGGRALTLGQDTVGTTFLRPAKKGEPKNAARVNLGSAPGPAEMKDINERLKTVGDDIFAVSTKDGIEIVNAGGTETGPFQRGVKKVYKGEAKPEFMHNTGGLIGNRWWEEDGGTAGFKPSRIMRDIDAQDLSPEAMKRVEKTFQGEADTLNKMDAALEASNVDSGKRDKILTLTRDIMVKKGFPGIREAVKKGLLPAVVLSVLGQQSLPTSDPGSEQS